ncbi:MAG: hypothetical protein ABR971_10510 [Acidobacteriaceae bacterium]
MENILVATDVYDPSGLIFARCKENVNCRDASADHPAVTPR